MENQETSPHSHSTLVDTFCEITSSSREEAQFFLESHNFDLDSAVSTFLETSSVAAPAIAVAASSPTPGQNISPTKSPSQSQSYSPSASASSSPSRSRSLSPPPHLRSVRSDDKNNNPYNLRLRQPMAASSNASKKKASSSRTGGIRALSDLNRRGRDTSDSEDDPQEYYTGGEKSGMLVQDPSKVSDVDAIFNQARRSGAGEGPTEHFPPSSTLRSFTGTARLLSGETVSAAAQHPEVITHNIIFWGNGFTVDDGPLRRLDDPTNEFFLESIRKSECPKELEPANRGTVVHVNLTRKEENFPVAATPCFPFQGVGRTLGSSSVSTSVKQDDASNSPNVAPTPSMGLVVDQNLPSTSLQLRLADGTRMVSRFNHHHTIRDIHAFIDSSRPGGARTYQLQTVGFPPKLLLNMDETIEQAGLANSVVIQKL